MLTFIAALTAARCFAYAETAPTPCGIGQLVSVDLDLGEQVFRFTPGVGSVYDVCVFPAEGASGQVHARLEQESAVNAPPIVREADGTLTLMSVRLSANAPCTLSLSGSGRVRLEIDRHALSRCFEQPLTLKSVGDSYSKAVARPGDVHWYAVSASESRPAALVGLPQEPGMRLDARLFSDDGRLLAEATRTAGGAFLMDFMLRRGRTYRIRVCAMEGGTGMYSLQTMPLEGSLPEAVMLSERTIRLRGHESHRLEARSIPESASRVLFWESSEESVARVSQNGTVTGYKAGTAVITAYAAGAVRARCRVEVAWESVRGIEAIASGLTLHVGDDAALEWRLIPETATETAVTFDVTPEGVVSVDEQGVVRALSEGEARITVRTQDGGFEAAVSARVLPAVRRWRALLVGEKNYPPLVASPRLGSANSVAGVRSMLNQLSYSGTRFEVTARLDAGREEVLQAIREAFAGATGQDTSLFYITCHGYYENGMTTFELVDGSLLTAQALREALDEVPGEIVVLADCCGSGGVIARASDTGDILRGIGEVFGGVVGPPVFGGSRYRVLASASVEQDSYRIGFDDRAVESSMATVFARAVCEGCGWSIERGARGAMRADTDGDGAVSLEELYRYANRRVGWYLSLNDGGFSQTLRAYPEGDGRALFER